MSFTEALAGLSVDVLREIVRRRDPNFRLRGRIETKRELCQALSNALSSDRSSIDAALRSTDRFQLQVLLHVVSSSGRTPLSKLEERIPLEGRRRLEEALDDLEKRGLVLRIQRELAVDLYVPDSVREAAPLPLPLRHNVEKTLNSYDVTSLDRLLRNLEIPPPKPLNKASRIAALTEELTNAERVRLHLEKLSLEARELLEVVIAEGGYSTLYDLSSRLPARQRNQLHGYDWYGRWQSGPRNPVEELMALGLLLPVGYVGWGYGHLVVPGDLLAALTGRGLLALDAWAEPELEPLPAGLAHPRRHEALRRDLTYFLGFLTRAEAQRTAKGLIHRSALKQAAKGLTVPTQEYAAFLYGLARRAEMIDTTGPKDAYTVAPNGLGWLELPAEEQLRSLAQLWRAQELYAEYLPDLLSDRLPYGHAEWTQEVRDTVVDLLKEAAAREPDTFMSVASLAARAAYRRWSRFSPQGRAVQVSSSELNVPRAEELVRRVCAESLWWLGLTELVGEEERAGVRLTPWGRHLLMEEPPPPASENVDSFVVQPNLEIFAPPNLAPAVLYRLFRIADPATSGMLMLKRENVRKALDQGESAEDLLGFLRQHSASGVPQNVEYMLNEVAGRHGHIQVGRAGVYVRVNDPVLLRELAAQPKLGIREILADTVAVVDGESVEAVLKQLRAAGYLPVEAGATKKGSARPRKPAFTMPRQRAATAARRESVEDLVDWDALTGDDGPGLTLLSGGADAAAVPVTNAPPGAAATPAEVASIIARAVQAQTAVEISYQAPKSKEPVTRTIRPSSLAGVLVHCPNAHGLSSPMYNLRFIRWARAVE